MKKLILTLFFIFPLAFTVAPRASGNPGNTYVNDSIFTESKADSSEICFYTVFFSKGQTEIPASGKKILKLLPQGELVNISAACPASGWKFRNMDIAFRRIVSVEKYLSRFRPDVNVNEIYFTIQPIGNTVTVIPMDAD